ncbi:MAG: ATP-binding protein [Clostridia bacterium]
MSRASLRRKLLVALLSALLLVGLAASGGTWLAVRREADQLFDYQLQQMALGLRDQTLRGSAVLDALDYDFIVQVWDPSGGLVYLSNRSFELPAAREGFRNVTVQGEAWRSFTLPLADKTIQVAAPLSLREDRASAMALRILAPLLASIPLFGILIWVLVGRELKPLERIAAAIRRRAPGSLTPLPESRLPDEARPMVTELNGLLARLGEAMDAQRRFVADAAHELRSPLTALQLQVGLVERAQDPAARREAIDALAAGVRRATRLVEQLLTLEQLGADAGPPPGGVPLAEVVAETIAELEPLAEAKRIELRLAEMTSATVQGREAPLRTLVRSLADNAIRYTPEGGIVSVAVRSGAEGSLLELCDSGPGIPAGERERVFDRFYRVPGSPPDGSGLGLSIAKGIADAHRATIELGDSPHGGLRVTVRFPPAP